MFSCAEQNVTLSYNSLDEALQTQERAAFALTQAEQRKLPESKAAPMRPLITLRASQRRDGRGL